MSVQYLLLLMVVALICCRNYYCAVYVHVKTSYCSCAGNHLSVYVFVFTILQGPPGGGGQPGTPIMPSPQGKLKISPSF